ncbi:MAG TPA: MazG nucleotide pyrophosphohydrolase domain-containing protein [Anaerolineae bacterium]|jgi:NTP pyrophosphatase (non-canonical NTP hydrolase)
MKLSDIQQEVAVFVTANRLETTVPARVLDLVSEVGEVGKEVLKGSDYGHAPFEPTGEWASELGDVLFSLICIANATGVDLAEALQTVLAKYEERIAHKGEAGSGGNMGNY